MGVYAVLRRVDGPHQQVEAGGELLSAALGSARSGEGKSGGRRTIWPCVAWRAHFGPLSVPRSPEHIRAMASLAVPDRVPVCSGRGFGSFCSFLRRVLRKHTI